MPNLGVCSWSLRPKDPRDLAAKLRATGVSGCQLALDKLRTGAWSYDVTVAALREAKVTLLSGMMEMAGEDYATLESIRRTGGLRPDATWAENLAAASQNAVLARRLGMKLVTFHAGFVPHERADPERIVIVGRLRELARAFAAEGIGVALETGQETAETLLGLLEDLAAERVGVNFDPANMILYGMGNPHEALARLVPFVRQVHVKDALPAAAPGEWGKEVRVGTGAVDWPRLLRTLPRVDLVIEREAGEQRVEDVIAARRVCE